MKYILLPLIWALPLAAEFYGNPSESCPQPFRLYTMADYLYWQASESNLEYAMKQRAVTASGVEAAVVEIDYPYKDGFRIGGGMVFPHYDWQAEVDWTRFYHNLRDTQSQSALIALWMSPQSYLTWANAGFSWDLKFDTLDLDLLRVGFTNRNFSFIPRIGLKRSWIKQFFHIRYENPGNAYYDIRYTNNFRAIGVHIGLDTQLWAGWGFNLTGSGATALSFGQFHTHRLDVSSAFASVDILEKNYSFEPMAQGQIALEWSRCLNENGCRILLRLGYEAQFWWGQNQLRNFISSALPPSNFKTNGALTLKGLDLHARFDF